MNTSLAHMEHVQQHVVVEPKPELCIAELWEHSQRLITIFVWLKVLSNQLKFKAVTPMHVQVHWSLYLERGVNVLLRVVWEHKLDQ